MERINTTEIFDVAEVKWLVLPGEVIDALNEAYHELDNQQVRINALTEMFDDLQKIQTEFQDIANKVNTLQMQPFWSHKLIAELAEPILRD